MECGSREEQPPFRPTAALGDGIDKCAGFPISPTYPGQKTAPEHGCGGMADSDNAAFISGDPGSRIHRKGAAWQLRMRQEMAEIKPGQLASQRAETQRDLLQDIFCCFWMLGLSPREEPTQLRSTCTLGETEVCVFPPGLQRGSGHTAGLQPQLTRGGCGRLRNETFRVLFHQPVAVTHLAGRPLSMVAMGHPDAFVTRRWNPARRIRSHQLAVGRLEKSHVSGQTAGLCSPPGSAGPSPNDFPAASRVTEAPLPPTLRCATKCYRLVGGQPHTSRGDLVGSLDFFFSLSPLPSSHPLPASHPPAQLPCAVGKETAPGKHTGLNFHLGTVQHSPRNGQARYDLPLSKIKARQKLSLLFPSCQGLEIPSRSKAYHSSGRLILGEGTELVI